MTGARFACVALAVLAVVVVAACLRNPGVVPPEPPVVAPAASLAVPVAPPGLPVSPALFAVPAAPPQPWTWFRSSGRVVRLGHDGVGAAGRAAWRGLRVAVPARCAPYEPLHYAAGSYRPRLPVARGSGFREPLGCSLFGGPGDPVVRPGRVVPAPAAHDAGLCARPLVRAAFAADPDNRLYVPVRVDRARLETIARGDGEWLPGRNLCWYVGTQLRVRRRYGLTVSPWEARVFEAVLQACPEPAPDPVCTVSGGDAW